MAPRSGAPSELAGQPSAAHAAAAANAPHARGHAPRRPWRRYAVAAIVALPALAIALNVVPRSDNGRATNRAKARAARKRATHLVAVTEGDAAAPNAATSSAGGAPAAAAAGNVATSNGATSSAGAAAAAGNHAAGSSAGTTVPPPASSRLGGSGSGGNEAAPPNETAAAPGALAASPSRVSPCAAGAPLDPTVPSPSDATPAADAYARVALELPAEATPRWRALAAAVKARLTAGGVQLDDAASWRVRLVRLPVAATKATGNGELALVHSCRPVGDGAATQFAFLTRDNGDLGAWVGGIVRGLRANVPSTQQLTKRGAGYDVRPRGPQLWTQDGGRSVIDAQGARFATAVLPPDVAEAALRAGYARVTVLPGQVPEPCGGAPQCDARAVGLAADPPTAAWHRVRFRVVPQTLAPITLFVAGVEARRLDDRNFLGWGPGDENVSLVALRGDTVAWAGRARLPADGTGLVALASAVTSAAASRR
jgi:hypothetical protein